MGSHAESGVLEEGLALADESVTESFEFSLYQFVSRFSVSELQWRATSKSGFRLGQPYVGFRFVAKDLLGLALNQLNIIHFLTHLRPIVGGRRPASGRHNEALRGQPQ